MKKILLFGGGFITGIVAAIVVLMLIAANNQLNDDLLGLTIFPEKGECITTGGEIEVFQVLKPNMALAKIGEFPDEIIVLLVNYDGKSYYDDQKIKISTGKCVKQIGTYQYTTKDKFMKTVPTVVIDEYDQKNKK
ncbi:MAG: hypothetical protein KBB52_07730 [Candidatus Omnitrophica bacterium]|nr:hypothetical protein [Candidatus Omnitrophota bacterium]